MDAKDISSVNVTGASPMARVDTETGYFYNIDDIREVEYPMLQNTTYLDHAGTTLYARSLVAAISHDLTTNLFGNPHSGSLSSQLSSRRIDDTRLQVLRFLNADPDFFDVIFVANATAAIKKVADAFRDHAGGFFYGYHVHSHTSLVGVRELAELGSKCFSDDGVDDWFSALKQQTHIGRTCILFGYPGQSNLSGYRPPWGWCSKIYDLRKNYDRQIYSLYDAAARLSTGPLDFSNVNEVPDFTAFSFYKIFGLPDLGALVVRKDCSCIFQDRKYFGGGTVDMIISVGDQWHASKQVSLHSQLEDGTLPFHSIIALGFALSTHSRLFGSMANISRHSSYLARRVHDKLSSLVHSTGVRVCHIYGPAKPDYTRSQGPTIAFNLRNADGGWIGGSEVERLASVRDIQLRTGGLCNPGGIATYLDMSASELRNNFAAGKKCGDDNDILNDKPTGVIRVSFGAMSNVADADKFIDFIEEFFVQGRAIPPSPLPTPPTTPPLTSFYVQSLSIYPIKSCAAFKIPPGIPWEVRHEGLAWDREWCLLHQGTGLALNQKQYPQMALIRPSIDLDRRVLTLEHGPDGCRPRTLELSLDTEARNKHLFPLTCDPSVSRAATACAGRQEVLFYSTGVVANFFTIALGVPCILARRQKAAGLDEADVSQLEAPPPSMPGRFPDAEEAGSPRTRSMSNESPILLVSQSSLDSLNLSIQTRNAESDLVPADSFRANIVIAQDPGQRPAPYAEDQWTSLQIGGACNSSVHFTVIGPCHRCQMVCVDQRNAKRKQEPFATLAKTRKWDGKVWFGMHLGLETGRETRRDQEKRFVMIGDAVKAER